MSNLNWIDREEYPFEPHSFQIPAGNLHYVRIPPHEAHLFQSKVPTRSNRLGPPIPTEGAHLFQRNRPTTANVEMI